MVFLNGHPVNYKPPANMCDFVYASCIICFVKNLIWWPIFWQSVTIIADSLPQTLRTIIRFCSAVLLLILGQPQFGCHYAIIHPHCTITTIYCLHCTFRNNKLYPVITNNTFRKLISHPKDEDYEIPALSMCSLPDRKSVV